MALGSSTLFHALVVLLASFTVLNAAMPLGGESSRPRALYAELDPVDNRETVPPSPGEGGGSPGEVGGTSSVPFVSNVEGKTPQQATRDPVADNLLAEILPDPQPKSAETQQRALPGPRTTGEGILPGSGSGGGEGVGGGSAGGAGRSIGPGTQFFGAREHAHSFTYVIDCSGSMATRNSLDVAKREMMASINQLAPDAEFAVIFYNLQTRILNDPQGQQGLMAATALNKGRVQAPTGGRITAGGHGPHAGPARGAQAETRGHFLSDRRGVDFQQRHRRDSHRGRVNANSSRRVRLRNVPRPADALEPVSHDDRGHLPLHRRQPFANGRWPNGIRAFAHRLTATMLVVLGGRHHMRA